MNRAAIYARVSRDDEENAENTSIKTQIRVCTERAAAEGWTVVATYSDLDVSGGIAVGDRPDGARLIAGRNAGEFDVLIVSEPTRLSRRDDLPSELKRWVARKVRVVFLSGGLDTKDKSFKLIAGIHGMIGEQYRDMISEKTHQALASRVLQKTWTGGRPFGYRLRAITDPSRLNAYGEPSRIGSTLVIDEEQASVVRRIFDRYTKGVMSPNAIAVELNEDRIPSPGSTWNRTQRRCSGWMASAVRVILANPIYKGEVRWNTSKWERDPDTNKKRRSERPAAEWSRYTYSDENVRIVTEDVWEKAQARTRDAKNGSIRLKSGGKPKFILSGLLGCKVCGQSYVLDNNTHYACASSKSGACTNRMRQRKDDAEAAILPVLQNGLLDPKIVDLMAKEVQREYNRLLTELDQKAAKRPAELEALDARIARLRARLRAGDPDLPPEELQAAIDRAIAKRAELVSDRPELRRTAKVVTMLPRAAEACRRQIAAGLVGNERETNQARAVIRQLVGGKIWLLPDPGAGHLIAEFGLNRVALLRAAGAQMTTPRKTAALPVGTSGSGGRI